MATLKEVKRLKELCEKYGLEGRGVLDGFPNTKLASMYNGIGPEKFPGWLRAVLDFIHPSLAPVALIHDVEWSLSDGTKESFAESNRRFRRNGVKVAKSMYSWWRPRRYKVMWDAAKFARLCQRFGWAAWMAPFTAKDIEEQRANAAVVLSAMKGAEPANPPKRTRRRAAAKRTASAAAPSADAPQEAEPLKEEAKQ